jgi:hypothetical protein
LQQEIARRVRPAVRQEIGHPAQLIRGDALTVQVNETNDTAHDSFSSDASRPKAPDA